MADAPKILATDKLNQAFPKLNQGIDNANEALKRSTNAEKNSGNALNTANTAKQSADSTRVELNAVVKRATDSDAMSRQAAINARGEDKGNLKARLDEEYTAVTSQLIGVDDKSFYTSITSNRNPTAKMVIVDDDGYPQVHQMLKPLTESEGVPIATAVITSRIDKLSASMTLQQIKECQAAGMEVVSHTHTHRRLSELTPEEQEYEIKTAKEYLQRHGFNHDVLVYPFGAADETTQKITARYHRAGVYIDYGQHLLNNPPILQYRLERVYYNDDQGNNYVQRCKDKIDEAITRNSLIIIGMHCFYDGFNPEGLREVIRYAKSRGIEITTFKRALESYSNIIDLPDFKVGANGEIVSNKIGKYIDLPGATGINGTTPIENFDIGTSRTNHTTSVGYQSMPVSSASVMFTHKFSSLALSFQEVFVISNKSRYMRTYDNTNKTWGTWVLTTPRRYTNTHDFGTIAAGETKRFTFNHSTRYVSTSNFICTPARTNSSSIPAGIIFNYHVVDGARANFDLTNVTGSPIEVGSVVFRETEFGF